MEQMTAEVKTKIVEEVKRFATDLNLSESQKAQLHAAFERAEGRLEQIRKDNPDVTRADVIKKLVDARDQICDTSITQMAPGSDPAAQVSLICATGFSEFGYMGCVFGQSVEFIGEYAGSPSAAPDGNVQPQ
jgi:hypothetical protein